MPGLLTHLITSFVGLLVIALISKKWRYGWAFVAGQLIPDIIKFGIPGIMFKTIQFNEIVSKPLFWQLNSFTHNITFWILISVLVLGITFMFYRMDWMKKQKFKQFILFSKLYLKKLNHS